MANSVLVFSPLYILKEEKKRIMVAAAESVAAKTPEATAAVAEAVDKENLLSSDVIDKYKAAADVAQKALAKVIEAAVDGAKVIELCQLGDAAIVDGVKLVFNKKKGMIKGIAFPTCVSAASAVCR